MEKKERKRTAFTERCCYIFLFFQLSSDRIDSEKEAIKDSVFILDIDIILTSLACLFFFIFMLVGDLCGKRKW